MSKKLYEESNIAAIALAIRNKNDSSDTYKVSEMAAAIDSIPVGSGSCQRAEVSEIYGDTIIQNINAHTVVTASNTEE